MYYLSQRVPTPLRPAPATLTLTLTLWLVKKKNNNNNQTLIHQMKSKLKSCILDTGITKKGQKNKIICVQGKLKRKTNSFTRNCDAAAMNLASELERMTCPLKCAQLLTLCLFFQLNIYN